MDKPTSHPASEPNPATRAETALTPALAGRKRIPMSIPRQKLQATEIEGYHTHWPLESRVQQFLQAGYEFVDSREVMLNNHDIAGDSTQSGNVDLGSRIRVVAGKGLDGQPEYHVLMKIRLEWFNEDRRVLEERNASVLSSIFMNEQILGSDQLSPVDKAQRYVDRDRTSIQGPKPLFQRPTRKSIR